MNTRCLQIFAKAPVPGQVKTRMQPVLSPEESAQLAKQLLILTLQNSASLPHCTRQLWCSPDSTHPWFQAVAEKYDLQCFDQPEGDLGHRMWHAIHQGLKTHQEILLIGADCPFLSRHYLETCFLQLTEKNAMVISPANDGGYVLIGSNQPVPRILFEHIHWGSHTVLKETLAQLEKTDIQYTLCPPLNDIDRPEDLKILPLHHHYPTDKIYSQSNDKTM